MRPSVALPTGTLIGRAGGLDFEPATQAFRGAHRDGAHHAVAQLLLHFEREVHVLQLQRVVHLRDRLARKLHVDDRTDDLSDLAR